MTSVLEKGAGTGLACGPSSYTSEGRRELLDINWLSYFPGCEQKVRCIPIMLSVKKLQASTESSEHRLN